MNSIADRLREPVSRAAFDYWNDLRGARDCPNRRDIRPEEVPRDALPHTVLIDVEDGPVRRYRYRLIGTRVVSYYGEDWTGRYFDEIAEGAFHTAVQQAFAEVIVTRKPHYAVLDEIWPSVTRYSRLSMPVSDDGATVNIIMVCVVAEFAGQGRQSFAQAVLGRIRRPESF